MYSAGTILFSCTPSDDQALVEAREYITDKKLTPENARMLKRTDVRGVESLIVILKEDASI